MKTKKIDYDTYKQFFPQGYLRKLNLNIDVKDFAHDIENKKQYFRRWGQSHLEYPRYGISLVNLTGNITDEIDPACWPLDEWWRKYPDKIYWDTDFNKPTSMLDLPCFSALNPIKEYMIRSNILLWHKDGHFKPHVDMVKSNISHLRIWGVTSSNYELWYETGLCTNWIPGQLYLIDTIPKHWALATSDDVYTFFISIRLDSLNIIRKLLA